MANTAADILLDTLQDWGVDVIFGLPGDGINGIIESLRKREKQIRFIQVRHEESAAFMACAYAKYTGKLGVCLATSGPGGIHRPTAAQFPASCFEFSTSPGLWSLLTSFVWRESSGAHSCVDGPGVCGICSRIS